MAVTKSSLSVFLVLVLVQTSFPLRLALSHETSITNNVATTLQPEPSPSGDFVPIDQFPEPFRDEKLPGAKTETTWCDTRGQIGCFKELPGLPTPADAESMKTVFSVTSGKQEVLVEYKLTRHCLKNDTQHCWIYPFDLTLIEKSLFNPELRTIIGVPGFKTGQFDPFLVEAKKNWNALEDINFIMVAWTGGNGHGFSMAYPQAAANTRVVARQISVLLYYLGLMKSDYQLSDDIYINQISMVGHSLGAHISGFVGKDMGGTLGSITGLDPAKPNFMHTISRFRLDRSDSRLVQNIHTNTRTWGIPEAIGDLDFYANDGTAQPGCGGIFNLGCSHGRAHEYYNSFLLHEKRMRDLKGNDSSDYKNHRLFAYPSKDFKQFLDGTSRRKLCPKSVLDDKTFDRSDINQCITPMDFVSNFDDVIANLYEHGIDVGEDRKDAKSRKLYFLTQEDATYLNNHFMFKIYFTNDRKEGSKCGITVDFKQPNGKVKNYHVGYYSLYENEGHLEADIPVMGNNFESKYALADVDAHDYYTNDVELLERKAKVIFPTAIRIGGKLLSQNESAAKQDNFLDWCNLEIESVHMEPLNKLNRYFSASYSLGAKGKKYPDVVFLENSNGDTIQKAKQSMRLGASSDAFLDIVTVGAAKGIPDMNVIQQPAKANGIHATILLTGTIVIAIVIVSTLAIAIDRLWLHKSRNSPDRQPIIGNN